MTTSGSQKNKMATAKIQSQGFKMVIHKSMGNAMTTTSIIQRINGQDYAG